MRLFSTELFFFFFVHNQLNLNFKQVIFLYKGVPLSHTTSENTYTKKVFVAYLKFRLSCIFLATVPWEESQISGSRKGVGRNERDQADVYFRDRVAKT